MNFQKLTSYLDSLEKKYGVPASDCKIMKDHMVIYRHKTGYSDYKKTTPVSEKDFYRLYSATKIITMIAVLQLVERGKIGLYDTIDKYLPEFAYMKVADHFEWGKFPIAWPDSNTLCHLAHNQIRIIDLMSMTSGLSYDVKSGYLLSLKQESNNKASTREMVRAIAKMPLLAEPQTRWSYSLGHDVLAAMVEVVSGMKYSDYLRNNIFNPAGSDDFYFHSNNTLKNSMSAIYQAEMFSDNILHCSEEYAKSFELTEEYESGGAGLITTVDAYSNIIDALSCGGITKSGTRILSEESIKLLQTSYTTGQMLEDFKFTGKKGYGYGLGVRVMIEDGASESPLGEFGWDGAAGAYVLVDPKNNISIFYAQHIMNQRKAYSDIHPMIRDLSYIAMEE